MKKILLLFTLLFPIVFAATAQEKKDIKSLLINKTWVIAEDKQSGIGQHIAFTEGTTLEFSDDGTWICSGQIEGENKGRWSVKNKQLLITPGQAGKALKFEIIGLDENTLRYKYKKFGVTKTHEWRKK